MTLPRGPGRAESKSYRELIELLQEMRVMLPGIEVIFGFLLTVPFTARFTQLTSLQRTAFSSFRFSAGRRRNCRIEAANRPDSFTLIVEGSP